MPTETLNERARAALLWMDENTDARPKEPSYRRDPDAWTRWERETGGGRKAYAFLLASALGDRSVAANGAANTLAALRRRGLVDRPEMGAFVQAEWWITDAGRSLASELRR